MRPPAHGGPLVCYREKLHETAWSRWSIGLLQGEATRDRLLTVVHWSVTGRSYMRPPAHGGPLVCCREKLHETACSRWSIGLLQGEATRDRLFTVVHWSVTGRSYTRPPAHGGPLVCCREKLHETACSRWSIGLLQGEATRDRLLTVVHWSVTGRSYTRPPAHGGPLVCYREKLHETACSRWSIGLLQGEAT